MALHRRAQALRYLVASSLAALSLGGCAQHAEPANNGFVCRLYAAQASRQEVVAHGKIVRVLGERTGMNGTHEGFLVQLDGDCDLLIRVATNETLTGPVPIHPGEDATVKGEYEFTPIGGVVHWTHHDPRGHHAGGWVSVGGKLYQ